jgi:hypothetical protein
LDLRWNDSSGDTFGISNNINIIQLPTPKITSLSTLETYSLPTPLYLHRQHAQHQQEEQNQQQSQHRQHKNINNHNNIINIHININSNMNIHNNNNNDDES